jgi:hypothetical protein
MSLDPSIKARVLRSRKFLTWHHRPRHRKAATFGVLEKHYSPRELAVAWGLSVDTIRKVFEKEPGVLIVGTIGTRSKRRYRTFRIPEHVAERVHNRLSP